MFAGNIVLLAVIALFVVHWRSSPATLNRSVSSVGNSNSSTITDPLDQLSSADVAVTIARVTNLPEATAVTNQADSVHTELAITQTADSLIAKPQVVASAFKSNQDIQLYIVKAGDTLQSIASKFNITSSSVVWSNGLSGNSVAPGQKLYIPPVNGIVYTVKSGDTTASLAATYRTSEQLIIAYNDAELNGLKVGERILIPNGSVAPLQTVATWGITSVYGYNGYDFGFCTWWVAKVRADAGHPLPANLGDASDWYYSAERQGLSVGLSPQIGAAVVTSTAGEGHVGYVTGINPDGSIVISEMNHEGWDVSDTRTLSGSFEYIY